MVDTEEDKLVLLGAKAEVGDSELTDPTVPPCQSLAPIRTELMFSDNIWDPLQFG